MPKTHNKGFLLRLDPDTMELVEKWAAQEFRSVNGQLQWIIADSLRRYGKTKSPSNKKCDE
ncbi:MAG: DNA-binding protein [Muribaculaceae bacterium]|nr:DNA-binding protein [Muribaculaceae bacterium]